MLDAHVPVIHTDFVGGITRGKETAAGRAPAVARLQAPRLASAVARPRLFKRLDAARRLSRVLWIAAPAGAGKTTLAASWVQARKLPVLWYQMDAGDGDIASFFYYMGLAARQVAPRYRQPLPLLTPEYFGDIPTFARNFFRELYRRLPRRCVLVLDNYQDIPEGSVLHGVMPTAMAEVPEGMNVLALSRSAPPSALARLRLCEEATCIDWDEVRLTPEETATIGIRRLGKSALDRQQLQTLHNRTHGWAAGVVLMLEQIRGGKALSRAPVPSGRDLLFDYFATELFRHADPAMQKFLLQTALLPQLTAAMAKSLTGYAQASQVLDDLVSRNYFTLRLDGPDPCYQYHPLFREFLLAHGRAHFSADDRRALIRQAAALLRAAGQIEPAAELLREGGDETALMALIEEHAPALAAQGRFSTLEGWLCSLPPASLDATPWASYWFGICRMPFDPRAARDRLIRAYDGFKRARQPLGLCLAWAGIAETFKFAWDDYTAIDRWVEELKALRRTHPLERSPQAEARVAYAALFALGFARPDDPELQYWIGRGKALRRTLHDGSLYLLVTMALNLCHAWTGNLKQMRETGRELSAYATAAGSEPLARLYAHLALAMTSWLSGDLAAARDWAERGIAYSTEQGILLMLPQFHTHLCYICQLDGDVDGVATRIAQVRQALRPERRLDLSHYHYLAAWVALERGEHLQARDHAEQALHLAELLGPRFPIVLSRIEVADVAAELGDFASALEQLDRAADLAARMRSELLLFMCDLARAWVLRCAGRRDECARALRRALARGREHGFAAYGNWHGKQIAALCAFALQAGIETRYVQDLIRCRRLAPETPPLEVDAWPWPYDVAALGRFDVLLDGKPLASSGKPQKKPIDMLKALISFGGKDVAQSAVTEALWPDAEGDVARRSFDTTLHRLRRLLGNDKAVRIEDGRLTLDPALWRVDVWSFERMCILVEESHRDVARNADTGSRDTEIGAAVRKTVALYRGTFLPADADQSWTVSLRERLSAKFLRIISLAGAHCEKRGTWEEAKALYEAGLERDDAVEEFYQRLMLCNIRLGRKAEAVSTYNRCRAVLIRCLGILPSARTEEIFASLKTAPRR
jgi:DNA-binding SARP family transcriptional activator